MKFNKSERVKENIRGEFEWPTRPKYVCIILRKGKGNVGFFLENITDIS